MSSRLSQMVRDSDAFRISCSCANVSAPPAFASSPFSYQNLFRMIAGDVIRSYHNLS